MITLPAGKYLIGDLCYRDGVWDEVLEDNTFDVKIEIKDGRQYVNFFDGKVHKLSDGRQYVIFDTAYGDGTYRDFDRNDYSVKSGTIGIIQWDGPDMREAMGRTFDFNSKFAVFKDGGDLHFGALVIETDPEMDEDFDADC